jgi:ABC-2 type transport system permease protein
VTGYLAIMAARFRNLLQYRVAALGGLFTQWFFGIVRIMVLEAFYQSTTQAQPMSFPETVGYVWMGQATLLLIPWNVDADIRDQIRSGSVAYELCRPLDLYGLWFARALAWRTAPMLLRMLPMFLIAMVILPLVGPPAWRLVPPPSLAAGLLWVAALAGAVLVSSALTVLMSITMFWTVSAEGIQVLLTVGVTVLGGLAIPLPLFPDWAQGIIYNLPFPAVLDFPSRIFIGQIPVADAPIVLARQLGWTLVLVVLGRWLMSRGARRLVVQGG